MAGKTWRDIFWELRQYSRKGGKKHRRRQRQRIMKLIRIAMEDGAVSPDHLAKRHAWQFYKLPGNTPTTLRDRFYAAKWLWRDQVRVIRQIRSESRYFANNGITHFPIGATQQSSVRCQGWP